MARRKSGGSPTVEVALTPLQHDKARQSDSGGCLIADRIKEQGYTSVSVDMATIRFTDPETGMRYTYLTPEQAQYILLAFDQGWPNPFERFTLRRAVKITPVIKDRNNAKRREERLAELEAKEASGEELTRRERQSLTKLRQPLVRPHKRGPSNVNAEGAVVGGHPLKLSTNPNLLRGRNRHFGAKIAKPGQVFQNAVEEAVNERLEQMA